MRQKLLASLLVLAVAMTANAEQVASPEVVVHSGSADPIRLTRFAHDKAAIHVDGYLTEPAWSNLPAIRELRVLEPDTLAEPLYATAVRIFYTELGLYVGFDLEQPTDTLVKRFTPRDDIDVRRDIVSVTSGYIRRRSLRILYDRLSW